MKGMKLANWIRKITQFIGIWFIFIAGYLKYGGLINPDSRNIDAQAICLFIFLALIIIGYGIAELIERKL
jgi:hypothetical protein